MFNDYDSAVDSALERGLDPEAEFERRLAKAFLKPDPDYSRLDIRISDVFPPIPIRKFDYCATDYATYDGPGCPIGYGETPQAAMLNLIEETALRDDTDPLQILLELAFSKLPA